MIKYKIHVNGVIEDAEKDFSCGIDISVSNGGSVENIGKALQTTIDSLHGAAVNVKEPKDKEEKKED